MPLRHLLPAALLALAASLFLPSSASAAWNATGNAVADSVAENEIPTSIAPFAGGCVVVYTIDDDSLRINRLFGATGTKAWGTSGVRVNPGGRSTGGLAVNDSAGGVWVAWYDSRPTAPGIYVQRFNASGTPQLAVGGLRVYHRAPGMWNATTGAVGSLLLTFTTPGDSVYIQRVASNGAKLWGSNGTLLATEGDAFAHGIDVHRDGDGAVVVYGRFFAMPGNPNSFQQVWANRVGISGAAQWGANGAVVFQNIGDNAIVQRSDWDGQSLFVSWLDAPAFYNFVEPYPILAQRLNGSGARQWAAGGVNVFTPVTASPFYEPTTSAGDHSLVADFGGGCVLVWFDTRHWHQPAPNGFDHFEDIYGQRLDATGTAQWAANGAVQDSMPGGIDELRGGVSDGAGGMLIAYTDHIFATNDRDIRLRRIESDGTSPWVQFMNSIAAGDDPSVERGPSICTDGLGGAFVAWEDNRNESTSLPDAYAGHRQASGSVFAPSMLVTAPNGGERFTDMEVMPIRWTSNFGGTVSVRLSRAPGQYTGPIPAFGTPNDGELDWDISDDQGSATCRIVISEFETGAVIDSSNAFFTICEPVANSVVTNLGGSQRDGLVADFNEDGILDLAASTGAGVAIQLGQGAGGVWNGTFAGATSVALAGARHILAADLNENGITDIVVTHSGGVSWLPGNGAGGVGNGTLGAPVLLWPSNKAAHGLDLGDFDADGIADLAVTLRDTNVVQILLGNGTSGVGNATFTSGQRFATSAIPERVVAADVNGDGVRDLLVGCRSGFVTRYLGTSNPDPFGNGLFGSLLHIAAGDSVGTMVVEDFNEDGALDVAVANEHGTSGLASGVTVLLGNLASGSPNGTFTVDAFYDPGNPVAMAATDINGDGRVDLLVAQTLLLNALFGDGSGPAGDGDFLVSSTTVGVLSPVDLTVADFNADGTADYLLTSGSTSSNASRVLVSGCAPLVPVALASTAPAPGAALFIDGTFAPLWTDQDGNGTTSLELSRDGGVSWEPLDAHRTNRPVVLPVTDPPTDQARLRVRDDLNPQRTDATDASFRICRAFANGTTVPLQDDGAAVQLADLDRDGDLDVVMATSMLEWRVSNGDGTFGSAQSLHTAFSTGFAVADFDDDGVLDVAGGQQTRLRVLRGGRNGAGAWDGTFVSGFTQNHATHEVEAGDFNEDGIEDLVARTLNATAVDSIHVYLGNGANGRGDGTFTLTSVLVGGVNSSDLEIADVNHDGILDVVEGSAGVAGAPPSGLSVFRGLGAGGVGNGSFAAPIRLLPGFGISALAIADLNGDGNLDVVAGGAAGLPRDSVVVLNGNGAGSFSYSTARRYSVPDEPSDIELADIDGNGLLDIVVSSRGTDKLVVLLRRIPGALTTGSFVVHQTFAGSVPIDAAVADLNGDGWRDLASVEATGQVLRVNLGACGPLPPRSITVEVPAGGESWDVGTDQTLRWSAPGVAHVDVELSRDGGTTWQVLGSGVQDTTLDWHVTAPPGAGAIVRVRDHDAVSLADASGAFTITGTTLDAPATRITVASFAPPRPNPSRGNVAFVLALPDAAHMTVDVFDIAGRQVRRLVDGSLAPGEHRLSWDGRGEDGAPLGAGVFFVRARGAGLDVERKFVRLR